MGLDSLKINGFDWSKGNQKKCQKHGVSISEIESIFTDGEFTLYGDEKHSDEEERFIAVGQGNDKRNILIVFTIREKKKKRFIRPISARYMHQKEVKYYEEETTKIKK
jgi:Uncharacterized protein conserved in bacteria